MIGTAHSSAPHSRADFRSTLRVCWPLPSDSTTRSCGTSALASLRSASAMAQAVGLLANTPPSISAHLRFSTVMPCAGKYVGAAAEARQASHIGMALCAALKLLNTTGVRELVSSLVIISDGLAWPRVVVPNTFLSTFSRPLPSYLGADTPWLNRRPARDHRRPAMPGKMVLACSW